ncbi:MAG TPA: FAD-dependent oxidoreductase [Gemmatimonadaceae bacterium]|nr:FAD-dependent oxidoreductase [Gemmatimonadaceae bacterium]
MSAGDQQLTGPDLAHGVPVGELRDGEPLLGHFEGEPAILIRQGEELFAVGASCTHYSGPLAEGLVVGDTLRCPWHHACFSLRTGAALRAPALNDVACYEVARENGSARIAGKREKETRAGGAAPARAGASSRAVVIVGAGAAGNAAAEMLRREGYEGSIVMIDPDTDAPYDRPNLSKDYLAGNAPEEWIPLHPPEFYERHRIEIVRARAAEIDVAARRVLLEGGGSRDYEALLLATGAEPVRLPLPVAEGREVLYLRSLADSRAIIRAAEGAKRAVVIGASFIGLEVAASLRARKLEVRVVAPESLPLERVMGSAMGQFIRALHEEHGVEFHLGRTVREVTRDGVVLDDGTPLAADIVVAGVGVRPNVALAERAGLALDRGVRVNEYLETSVTGIYAAGDIARWPDPYTGERIRVEHWVVAERMGQAVARNIVRALAGGRRERFDAVPFFWSQHYDVSINYVGHAERWDAVEIEGDLAKRDGAARFVAGARTLALATIFRDRESLEEELTMERAVSAMAAPA